MEMTWAWIAGFFEGEGYVGWKDRDGRSYCRVIIGQTDPRPLNLIADFLRSEGIHSAVRLRAQGKIYHLGKKPFWMLDISRQADVLRFLLGVKDLLIQKREKAESLAANITTKIRQAEEARTALAGKVEQAKTLRAERLSWRVIAERVGLNRETITRLMRRAGHSTDRRRIDWQEVDRLRALGKRWRDVAAAVGFSISTLKTLTRRRRTGRR
jgi:CRP-like cAMP-binding protein